MTVRGLAAHSSAPPGRRRWPLPEHVWCSTGFCRWMWVSGGASGTGRCPRLLPRSIRSWPEATHTIQDEVRLVFDRRLLRATIPTRPLPPSQTRLPSGSRGGWTRVAGRTMFSGEISAGGRLALAVQEGCRGQGLPEMSTFHSSGALDAGLFHALGADAAMWGPGDMGLWHSDDEGISIDELEQGARGYSG